MSSALVSSPTVRRAVIAAGGVAAVAALGLSGVVGASAAGSPGATPGATGVQGPVLAAAASPAASVVIGTTRSTVHAAGSTVPGWGLVFLIALFVVAVAVALPTTRRRSVGA